MIRCCLIVLLIATTSGCIEHRRDHSLVRAWADWNSFAQPSLNCEKLYHQPYKPVRVDHFRWMYGKPPGKWNGRFLATSTEPIGDVWPSPYPTDQPAIPPVPPPEAVESPSPEAEPFPTPLPPPPIPVPIREPEPPDAGPTSEEPGDVEQTSYRAGTARRSTASWLFAR